MKVKGIMMHKSCSNNLKIVLNLTHAFLSMNLIVIVEQMYLKTFKWLQNVNLNIIEIEIIYF
jgi:hypothetical protein